MNTNPPTLGAEEGTVSAPLEKLPKLNLPPKPVRATAANTTPMPVPATPPPVAVAASKPVEEPPFVPTTLTPPPLTAVSTQQTKPQEVAVTNKKGTTLSMKVALIAFVAALLALLVQVKAFLDLF